MPVGEVAQGLVFKGLPVWDDRTMKEIDYDTLLEAVEHALANFLGTDDLDQNVIELVSGCTYQALNALPDWTYFGNLLEKASTYVRVDMDELEMQDFVGEIEEQLEDYGIL